MTITTSCSKTDFAPIFKRDDIRGLWPAQIDCTVMELIGRKFAEMVAPGGNGTVVIGHDARNGSPELAHALQTGIQMAGAQTVSLGLCSTEQIYYMTGRYPERFAAGAMVTASHNPPQYNGVKFIHGSAQPFTSDELDDLRKRLENDWRPQETLPIGDEFADYMFKLAGLDAATPLQGPPLKLVVAAGNGVGAAVFRPFSERLTALGILCDFLDAEPDGNFPNGIPNPLLDAFNARLGNAVKLAGADMGIGFDGDADRAGFTDENGTPIIPSHILALVANEKLKNLQRTPGETPVIMANLCCSHLLKDLFLKPDVADFIETPVGHGQIKQLMRLEQFRKRVIFAGEHSGHYFYPEFFSVDSGVLTSLCMIRHLMKMRQNASSLAQSLKLWRQRYAWSGELNFKMPDDTQTRRALDFIRHEADSNARCSRLAIMPNRMDGHPELRDVSRSDGDALMPDVKVISKDKNGGWWLVLRPSGNEPMLRLNAETWGRAGIPLQDICTHVQEILRDFGGVKA